MTLSIITLHSCEPFVGQKFNSVGPANRVLIRQCSDQVLALSDIIFVYSAVSGDGIFCEGKAGYIRCPPGEVIVVYNANYGRTEGADVCPHKSISNTNCRAATSYRKVSELCDGKSSCKVTKTALSENTSY